MSQKVKLPKLPLKSKSMNSSAKTISSLLDLITSKSWIYSTSNVHYGFKSSLKREIASLTKIMTAICAFEICDKYAINIKNSYFKVTEWASATIGTTADLTPHSWVTVEDLLYGLMLPSGNDAAVVLCENLGAVLYFDKMGNKSLIQQIRSIDLTEDYESIKFYAQEFINFMNQKSRSLKMGKTRFANPHGLDHLNNYSCCDDVLLMSRQAYKIQKFRKIIKTVTYKGMYKIFKDGKVISKPIYWKNTNKLLEKKSICGMKTGITNKAGGCLATVMQIDVQTEAFIIVLGSNSTQNRFNDSLKIIDWAVEQATGSNLF